MAKFKQSFCLPCFWESTSPQSITRLIQQAAKIGYPACEIWGRNSIPFDLICQLARDHGMQIASMCGHGSQKDAFNKKENHAKTCEELLKSMEIAGDKNIPNLICFSGNRYDKSDTECAKITAEGLARVSRAAEEAKVTLNLELLNSKVDHKGYQCDHTAWGIEVVKQIGSPGVKLLYDIYHMQIMEGDLCRTISDNIQHIGHFHTAGNPGRKDMDQTQEINYPAVIEAIEKTGYSGYVAHEFFPKGDRIKALEQAFMLFSGNGKNPKTWRPHPAFCGMVSCEGWMKN